MGKKTAKVLKNKKKMTLMDRIPNNHGEWLQKVIELTEKALSGHNLPSEQFLVRQIERLNQELDAWKVANPK